MRLLIALLALCGCQSAPPLRLYDGPERPPAETAQLSLSDDLGISSLWSNALVPENSRILEVNGRKAFAETVEVLPGPQKLLIEGYHQDSNRTMPTRLLDSRGLIVWAIATKQVEFHAEAG